MPFFSILFCKGWALELVWGFQYPYRLTGSWFVDRKLVGNHLSLPLCLTFLTSSWSLSSSIFFLNLQLPSFSQTKARRIFLLSHLNFWVKSIICSSNFSWIKWASELIGLTCIIYSILSLHSLLYEYTLFCLSINISW